MTTNKALHFSSGKLGIDQIPAESLALIGLVYSYGEHKYARDNWKAGTEWHEFYGSAMRHLQFFWMGEDNDPESGLPHLAHAAWNILTLLHYGLYHLGTDDRPQHSDDLVKALRSTLEKVIERAEEFHKDKEPTKLRLARPETPDERFQS